MFYLPNEIDLIEFTISQFFIIKNYCFLFHMDNFTTSFVSKITIYSVIVLY